MEKDTFLNPQDTNLARYQDPYPTLVGNLIMTYQFSALRNLPVYERLPLGGWQINTVLRAQNGNFVTAPSNVTFLTNDFRIAHPGYGRSFNTCYLNTAGVPVASTATAAACDANSPYPAFQQRLNFTLQTNSQYLNVRQVVHPLLDASLFKQFRIRDRFNFEIRGEFFNIMNTPNFGAPGAVLGSATFGKVTLNQANDARIGQLTARINF